jgi:hydroxyacylglutathione hydrolase
MRLGRIGFDHVKGYLALAMQALADRPDLVWRTERFSAPKLAEELAGADPPLLLDVRNPPEWGARHYVAGERSPEDRPKPVSSILRSNSD